MSVSYLPYKDLVGSATTPWVRPADWLTLTAPTAAEEKFVGLHAVYPDSNFLALSAAGDYTVNWGDGLTENFSSGVVAYHQYDYNDADLSGTESTLGYKQAIVTVTPQVADTFTQLNLHQRHNQTGLQQYSSGFLDIAIAGQYLTDIRIGVATPGSTTQTIRFADLERVNIVRSNLKTAEHLLYACYSLQNIVDIATSTDAASSKSVTFQDTGDTATLTAHGLINGDTVTLKSLTTTTGITVNVKYYVVNATANTFQLATTYDGAAIALTTDGSGVYITGVTFSSMLNGCSSLSTIPLLNTAAGTNFSAMFYNCYSLTDVPLINTAAGINFSSMFQNCYSLTAIPLLDTAAGTSFAAMFYNCYSLVSVPLLSTAAGTNFNTMFQNCYSLTSVPLLDTAAGTAFAAMFYGCYSLTSVPLLNTAAGTNFTSMFQICSSLTTIPLLNTAAGTNFSNMFNACPSLTTATLQSQKRQLSYDGCKLSETALTDIITNLGTANTQGLVLTLTNNWGSSYGSIPALSGTTTAGSTTVAMASTTGIEAGMQVTGTGTPSTTAIACTFQDTGDTVTKAAHGLSNGDEVSFATIVTTTGIIINTIYFVVGAATDTFQLALTEGGAAIALTTDGSGTLRYKATVTAIDPNVSVTLSRPATSSATNTLAFRTLKTNTALLKGWAVTG